MKSFQNWRESRRNKRLHQQRRQEEDIATAGRLELERQAKLDKIHARVMEQTRIAMARAQQTIDDGK